MTVTGRTITAALAATLAAGPAFAPAYAQSSAAKEPQPVVVVAARVTDFVDRVEALGTTRAYETVRVTANVTEKIVKIGFDDGQRVGVGDTLVVLDKTEEEADLKAGLAVVAERRLAFERAEKLERRKHTATAQLDERRAALREAEARVEAIQSRIENRIIRAPFGGVVGMRNISVGALVEPGDLITTLDDYSVIKLDFNVPATFLSTLRLGLPILARTGAFGAREFRGEVKSIDSRVDPVSRSIVARAVLPNDDGALKPGLLMTVELLKRPRKVVMIPEEALIPRGRQNFVLVVDTAKGNAVERRQVEIGARRPGEVEVRAGLEAGETVITHGTMRVRPGQKVAPTLAEPKPDPADDAATAAPES